MVPMLFVSFRLMLNWAHFQFCLKAAWTVLWGIAALFPAKNEYVGAVQSEVGRRKGMLTFQDEATASTTRLVFEISTRGILGLRGALMTLTKGTAIVSSIFLRYEPVGAPLQKLRKGVLIATALGNARNINLLLNYDILLEIHPSISMVSARI